MAIILFDNAKRNLFAPLSLTKAISSFHFGLLSIQERWSLWFKQDSFVHTSSYLQPLYEIPPSELHIWVDAAVIPSESLVQQIVDLAEGQVLVDEKGVVAGKSAKNFIDFSPTSWESFFESIISIENVNRIEFPWEIMLKNDVFIREDFKLVTKGRKSQPISPTVQLFQSADIFIEEGAKLEFCTLNSSTGPIYIGKQAEIMEGSTIRGPFSIGFNSVLKMNSRVYGATSLGPNCMGGGEIKNSVIMGNSNKAHDGYLGDAVVGEWCNFGAGSSNSNLKNSAGDIKVWSMDLDKMISVGQKCGVIMGDYSRLSINSSVNTGSVIGVSCNVFGAGLLPKKIPNFSWGLDGKRYNIDIAINDINNWKIMKKQALTKAEMDVLQHLYLSK
jgi:UDP-N-acetylglucosamine diphosphorylase / glucose-1-phosphate thymidylyltransferase / UDP-N-acetylgalactosamine diphosphorylase / glucosamine-1-phosphate N-acetyltransferase / galactosamine-1-phosphate N-acetyltransferase